MSYVIETGYVIEDDPMPINEEADKVLQNIAGLVGACFIGSGAGFGTRYMQFEFDDDVPKNEAKRSLVEFNAWVKKFCPADAPYSFLDGVLSDLDGYDLADLGIKLPDQGDD